jgi:sRNA-binding protein
MEPASLPSSPYRACKPLAIGIDVEIRAGLAGEASKTLISDTLRWWTQSDSYLIALSPNLKRSAPWPNTAGHLPANPDQSGEHAACAGSRA